jgi:hypothetical protein
MMHYPFHPPDSSRDRGWRPRILARPWAEIFSKETVGTLEFRGVVRRDTRQMTSTGEELIVDQTKGVHMMIPKAIFK